MSLFKYTKVFIPALIGAFWLNIAKAQEEETNSLASDSIAVNDSKLKRSLKLEGIIYDSGSKKPLSGVKIGIKNFSATISDEKGGFKLSVPDFFSTVQFELEGYHLKNVTLSGQKSIKVFLLDDQLKSQYEEIYIPDYIGSRNLNAGSISSVDLSSKSMEYNETIDNFLQGKVSGLNVTRRSGTPGVGGQLSLHGYNSLNRSTQPLFVVDGMLFDNENYGSSLIGGHHYNPLQQIDIRDIQNITVVKDASISSIYGSKAANGVIFITTHHAKELSTKIDFTFNTGLNIRPSSLPVLNNAQYKSYLADLLTSSNAFTNDEISALPFFSTTKGTSNFTNFSENDTKWQNEVFKNSLNKNAFIKITGGDNIAKYALSMGYSGNKSAIQGTGYSKYNTRFNADLNLTKKLTANSNLAFTYAEQDLTDQGLSARTNPLFAAIVKAPIFTPYYRDSLGANSPVLSAVDPMGLSNPASLIKNGYNNTRTYRFFGSVNFVYKFNKYLNLNNQIGINFDKTREKTFVPSKGVVADTLANALAKSTSGAQVTRYFSLYNDTRLNYSYQFDKHNKISGIAGLMYQTNNSELDYAYGYNAATDYLISVGFGTASLRDLEGERGKWNWLNNYYSANYSFRDKYLASVAMSINTSSKIGDSISHALTLGSVKYSVNPSASFAWLVSSEKFMNKFSKMDLLKVRLGYGIVGNDDIGNYAKRLQYKSQNILGVQGLVRANFANPEISWEKTTKFNSGLDLSLFNERISLSADIYSNLSSRLLVYKPVSEILGDFTVPVNQAKMFNKGVDVQLSTILVQKKVRWSVDLFASHNKNIIKGLSSQLISSYPGADAAYISVNGKEANLYYGYKTNGIYTTTTEATNDGLSIKEGDNLISFGAGDIRFVDQNNDKIINNDDRVVIGNPNPDLFGSVNNHLRYKRWSMDAILTYSIGNDVYNYVRRQMESQDYFYNQSPVVINRWRTEGQNTSIPKTTYGDPMGNSRFSDRWIEDGSYLRLRSCSLGYDLSGVKQRLFRNAKVYLTGYNLMTFTKYLGFDPEFSATNSMFTQGVDTNLEPIFKTIELGIKIGL